MFNAYDSGVCHMIRAYAIRKHPCLDYEDELALLKNAAGPDATWH
jgi:hypothetical protein